MQNSVGKKSLRNCLDRVRLASIKPTLVPRSTEQPQVIIEQAHAQACLYLLMPRLLSNRACLTLLELD